EITDTIISNIENADVKAANKKTIKKAAKKNIPNGIWLKIVGSTINKRTGAASGARPNEKTAGKIASPDNRTTITFIPTIDSAERGKLCCFGKYELYVIMTDTPTLNVKNDCLIAFKIVFDVIFEKSGRNKNSIPLTAPRNVTGRMTTTIQRIVNAGIIKRLAFSMPFWIPLETTIIVIKINRN